MHPEYWIQEKISKEMIEWLFFFMGQKAILVRKKTFGEGIWQELKKMAKVNVFNIQNSFVLSRLKNPKAGWKRQE